jgi:integrase
VRVRHIDRRHNVKVSLKTRDRIQALSRLYAVNQALEQYWCQLATREQSGEPQAADDFVQSVRLQICERMAGEQEPWARTEVQALHTRLDQLQETIREHIIAVPVPETKSVDQKPAIPLKSLFERYQEMAEDELMHKSPNQCRVWRNTHSKALKNFISVTGNKLLRDITRNDALQFRDRCVGRIKQEGIAANTVNKEIGCLSKMFRCVDERLRLGLENPFTRLRLHDQGNKRRKAFDVAFVQDRLLAPGALSGLNDEARLIVMAMADTGARLGELCNLRPGDIHLDGDAPWFRIRAYDHQQLKTPQSERDIPLVGSALAAFRERPQWFDRYRDKGSSLSATVNKYLKERKLRPTDDHTLYSLRHTFQDRLNTAEVPERIQAELMGHKFHRPLYGNGPSIAEKHKWMMTFAFEV